MTAQTPKAPITEPILIITPLEGVENTAAVLAEKLGLAVEVVSTRAAALRLLNRRTYVAVVLDQMLADSDPEGADLIWKNLNLAIPMQIGFAVSGAERVERELRAALARRQRETQLATAAAAAAVDAEIKNAVTAMLIESQRALTQSEVPPEIADRLHRLADVASRLRERLAGTPASPTTLAALPMPRS